MVASLTSTKVVKTVSLNISASAVIAGMTNTGISKQSYSDTYTYSSSPGATGALPVNEVCGILLQIPASGTFTMNLQAIVTDVAGQTFGFVTVREYDFFLLQVGQAAFDSSTGTPCSSITVGGAGSNANTLGMGGTAPTFTVDNGGHFGNETGSLAGGIPVTSSLKNVLITNDAVNQAVVLVIMTGVTQASTNFTDPANSGYQVIFPM